MRYIILYYIVYVLCILYYVYYESKTNIIVDLPVETLENKSYYGVTTKLLNYNINIMLYTIGIEYNIITI